MEHLLGHAFVVAEEEPARAAAGIRKTEQIKIGGDVHVLGVIAGVGLGEIEDEIGAATAERDQRLTGAVEHLIERLVAKLLQRFKDLFPVFLGLFLFALALA
jgi:hypothetical protein